MWQQIINSERQIDKYLTFNHLILIIKLDRILSKEMKFGLTQQQ